MILDENLFYSSELENIKKVDNTIDTNDTNDTIDTIDTSDRSEVMKLFDYEKTSKTIEEDKKKTISLNEINNEDNENEDNENEDNENEKREVLKDNTIVEDYYSSAELFIKVTEWLILLASNIYIKQKGLDKITAKEFEINNISKKELVKAWANVLFKYRAKFGVEMRLLLTMGGIYGSKIKSIINEKELEKLKKENEILKIKNEALIKNTPYNESTKQFKKDFDFTNKNLEVVKDEVKDEVIKEVKDEVIKEVKEPKKSGIDLLKKK